MPKPRELSETAQRILALLEEAGEDAVSSTINTVFLPPRSAEAMDNFVTALLDLVNSGYARMAQDRDASRRLVDLDIPLSVAAVLAIPTYIQFVENPPSAGDDPEWVDTRSKGPPYAMMLPRIVLTTDGSAKADEIMTARGWEWWIPRAKK